MFVKSSKKQKQQKQGLDQGDNRNNSTTIPSITYSSDDENEPSANFYHSTNKLDRTISENVQQSAYRERIERQNSEIAETTIAPLPSAGPCRV